MKKKLIACMFVLPVIVLALIVHSEAQVFRGRNNRVHGSTGQFQVFHYSQDNPRTLGIIDTTNGRSILYNTDDNTYSVLMEGMIHDHRFPGVASPAKFKPRKKVEQKEKRLEPEPQPQEPTPALPTNEHSILQKK